MNTADEMLLMGAMSFLTGLFIAWWTFLKVIHLARKNTIIQNLAVVRDVNGQPFLEFCVDIPVSVFQKHFHPRFHVDSELAEMLLEGMDKTGHPETAEIHEHMMRRRAN